MVVEWCVIYVCADESLGKCRFAPLLQKKATPDEPSRVIITGSVAGLAVGSLGKHGK